MTCSSCGCENREDAGFCGECGAALARVTVCPGCQRSNPPSSKFCDGCGARLAEAAARSPERDPRSYTPRHLAEKILRSRSALEGERKQVTVLFADVTSSTGLAGSVDPEELHRILDRFFGILADGVHRFEGTINQYTGDGIMALFGAPIAHEDHAQRACYAALHLTDELRRYTDELRLRGQAFSIRMGINSGEVVVGKIGADLRMDYTAQGQTVNLAARMERIAESGRVCVSEATARLVKGYFRLRDLGAASVKGVEGPVRVYELEGIGPLRTRLQASGARGFSRFVGRAREMRALEEALEEAVGGNGRIVSVVAEPGTGKSRLCYEFAERCRARGLPVYEAQALSHGKAIPFLPVLQLLRAYFGIMEQDSDETARDKIAGRAVRLDESLSEALPLLFDFLGVPDPERPLRRMDPEARQRELFAVLRQIRQARSQRAPAVFLFEDLHWIDPGSEAFLQNLAESVPASRTLLLWNFRPEYNAGWMQKSYYQQIPLVPLGPEATGELLGDLLGPDPSLDGLKELLRARTGGNPFFIEEVVQSLVESGCLQGKKGEYVLARSVGEIAVPATVQAVLAARIDRLSEREKHLLQTAAVIGERFSRPVLEQVAELPELELADALHSLVASELLHEEELYPVAEYAFKHPLTREVAYRSQLGERRRRIHAEVARALKEVHRSRLDEQAALLAHHFEQAGETLPAARWHRRAAEWAGINNILEAIRHWRKVRELCAALPESEETLDHALTALIQLMLAENRAGDLEAVPELYREARELAARSPDSRALTLVLVPYGINRNLMGESSEGHRVFEEALHRVETTGERDLKVVVRFGLSLGRIYQGRLSDLLRNANEGIDLAGADLDLGADLLGYSPAVFLMAHRGSALAAMGRLDEARRDLDRAIDLARKRGDLFPGSFAHGAYVGLCEITGDAHLAILHGREAVELAERLGFRLTRAGSYTRLGLAYGLNSQWSDSLGALETAVAIRVGESIRAEPLIWMTRARLGLGDAAGARAAAEEAVQIAHRLANRAEIQAQLALARVLLRTEGAKAKIDIERALDAAGALIEETGARAYLPFIHLERAELARLTGDDSARERHYAEAHRLFSEMGAKEQAERALHATKR